MNDIAITLTVLVIAVIAFIGNRIPVGIVAIGAALALFGTGVLTLDQAIAGFGDPVVVYIAALFVVSEALDATGVTAWAGQQLIDRAGTSKRPLVILIMLLVAVLTALITVNGAVAALIPMVVVVAMRIREPPSQLLMPLAFAAHAGSMLALTGTPVNVLVSEAAVDAGARPFGYFEFALVGIPMLIGTILIAVLLGPKLLPRRAPTTISRDLSSHARTLVDQYVLREGAARLRVLAVSALVGATVASIRLSGYPGLVIDDVVTAGGGVRGAEPIEVGDVLVVRGESATISRLAKNRSLEVVDRSTETEPATGLISRSYGVTEVVIPPRSSAIGDSVFPGMVTESGDLVILAVQRAGDERAGVTVLAAGDTLLLQGTWEALDSNTLDPNVLVVDTPLAVRRQAVPMGPKAKTSLVVLAAMVVLLATGLVAPVLAAMLAAVAMIVLRVVSVEQAHRSMSWTTLILVGGMIPVSTAIQETGAADLLAEGLISVVGAGGPYLLLFLISAVTVVLGQLISNTATALILIPIAVSIASELGVSPLPLLMAVTVSAAASFITPVATPANMMILGPGGYQFGDYWKLGLPMLLLFVAVATFLVPVFWAF